MCWSILVLELVMYPCCIRSCCTACLFVHTFGHPQTVLFSWAAVSLHSTSQHYGAWAWLCAAAQRFQQQCLTYTAQTRLGLTLLPAVPPFAQEKLFLFTECNLCLSRHCSSFRSSSMWCFHISFLSRFIPQFYSKGFSCWMLNPGCLPFNWIPAGCVYKFWDWVTLCIGKESSLPASSAV